MISSGDTSIRKSKVIGRRIFILSIAKVIVFTGIVGRLFSLQVNENKKYLRLSDKNRLREWKLPPVRGEFFDYFGNVVAGNMDVYRLHVIPEQVENFNNLMVRLKTILELSDKEYSKIVKKKNKQKPWETIIISENLSWAQFSKLNLYTRLIFLSEESLVLKLLLNQLPKIKSNIIKTVKNMSKLIINTFEKLKILFIKLYSKLRNPEP